jgi:glycerol-3-phosphate acyltransferase PlsY
MEGSSKVQRFSGSAVQRLGVQDTPNPFPPLTKTVNLEPLGFFMNLQYLLIYGLLAGAYLLGSIPWGVLLTRAFGAADPRRHGSGNIGATNVARVGGLGLGLATLSADMLKGLTPVWLCMAWAPDSATPEIFPVAAALLAFFGHLFPIYSGFRGGGKGVATAFGGFAPIAPTAVLAAVGAFAIGSLISRRVSVGSLAAALALPFAVPAATHSWEASAGAALASVFIFIRHAGNIRRLIAGSEPVFRLKRKKA